MLPKTNNGNKNRPDKGNFWQEALPALTLGWNLAIPIFGGVLLGYFLDHWFGTGYIFTIGLLVLGIFIGFYNLAKVIRKLDSEGKKNENPPKGGPTKP